MAKLFTVPEVGVVEFPDAMTDSEIQSAIVKGLGKVIWRGAPYKYQISDEFQYRQPAQTAMGRAVEEQEARADRESARSQEIAYWSVSVTVMVLFVLIAWGWGKWRTRFASIKAFVFGLKPGEVLQVTWVISKCALAIATTILILNLIHDRPWLWMGRH